MPTEAHDILKVAAKTYEERQAIYGSNWIIIGQMLSNMFPKGLHLSKPEDFSRFYFIVLKVAKMTRYANNFHKGGHQDSIHDDMVYGAMLEAYDEELKNGNDGGIQQSKS